MDLKDVMKELLTELGKVAKTDAVVGTVRDAGKAKRGTEESDAGAEAGGAGGAIVIEPRAFVVVGEDGEPHMLALQPGKAAVVRRGIEILPERRFEALPSSATPPELGPRKDG